MGQSQEIFQVKLQAVDTLFLKHFITYILAQKLILYNGGTLRKVTEGTEETPGDISG